MSDPILERITQDIEDWLKKVKKADGYANDFVVERRKRQGNAPKAGQVLVVVSQQSPQIVSDQSYPDIMWDQPYSIDIYVDPDASKVTPVDTDINSAWADAITALTYAEDSRNRGGLAQDTKIDAPNLFAEGPLSGVEVRITVRYTTIANDPRSSAYSNV